MLRILLAISNIVAVQVVGRDWVLVAAVVQNLHSAVGLPIQIPVLAGVVVVLDHEPLGLHHGLLLAKRRLVVGLS